MAYKFPVNLIKERTSIIAQIHRKGRATFATLNRLAIKVTTSMAPRLLSLLALRTRQFSNPLPHRPSASNRTPTPCKTSSLPQDNAASLTVTVTAAPTHRGLESVETGCLRHRARRPRGHDSTILVEIVLISPLLTRRAVRLVAGGTTRTEAVDMMLIAGVDGEAAGMTRLI